MEPMIQVENLCKSFSTKNGTVEAARNISFSIEKGEIFGIIVSPERVKVHWCDV